MKPGDIVTISKWTPTHRFPVACIPVYDRFDDVTVPFKKKWEQGEVGLLLEGRDAKLEIVQVLHSGRVGWVDEKYLEVISEAG